MKKANSGITLIALMITIIVMIIISSIAVHEGKKVINISKAQTLETNMLTIQAKVKAYIEEIESKIWVYKDTEKDNKRDEEFLAKGMSTTTLDSEVLEQISEDIKQNAVSYKITGGVLTSMGLDEIKEDVYAVIFNKDNNNLIDIVYIEGFSYKENKYYSLSSLQQELKE